MCVVCVCVCVCVCFSLSLHVCVSVCACARSHRRALEAYGNCGLPTGLLGRVCASGSGASRSVSAAFIHSVRHSPYSSVRPRCEPRGLRPGCFSLSLPLSLSHTRFSRKTRDRRRRGITSGEAHDTRIAERTWSDGEREKGAFSEDGVLR